MTLIQSPTKAEHAVIDEMQDEMQDLTGGIKRFTERYSEVRPRLLIKL